jgi:hypothetical protein
MRKYIDIITESLTENPDDYRGQHQAPDREGGAPLYDVATNTIYPQDIYGPNGYRYYGADTPNAFYAVMAAKGRPNLRVMIYRAIPKELKNVQINPGDWVAIDRDYAKEHGESSLNGYRIISKSVFARDVFTDGNSLEEWGYDPQPRLSVEAVNAIKTKFGMKSVEEERAARSAEFQARKAARGEIAPPQEPQDDEPLDENAPTIKDATEQDGYINRQTANRIVDPKGYFHPSSPLSGKRR